MTRRVLRAAALSAAVGATAVAFAEQPAAAVAATVDTPNACRYNVDGGWRDHRMPLTGTVTAIAGDPTRDPGVAVTGESIALRVTPSSPALIPDWIRSEGYERGFFAPGVNEFDVEMWIAIEGSNTTEKLQVHRFTARGRLVIRTNPDGSFRESDPGDPAEADDGFRIVDMPTIDTTWTARGGRVEFRQASGGGLVAGGAAIPGVHGEAYPARGSIVARVAGLAGEGSTLLLDCEPGVTTEGEGELHEGHRRYQAKPFASVVVPGSVCIDRFGSERLDREITGRSVELRRDGDPRSAVAGRALRLDGTRLEVEIPRDDVLEMYRQEGGSSTLIAGAGRRTYPLEGRVAIRGAGTVEGTQSVALSGSWSVVIDQPEGTADRRDPGVRLLDPEDPTRELDVVRLTVALPETSWTPTGAEEVAFSLAAPGTAGAMPVVDRGVLPGGRDDAFTIHPYGSMLLRQGTDREGLDLDCLNGTIAVTGTTAYSTRGNLPAAQGGSAGRYAVAARDADPFFVAPLAAVTTPDGPSDPGATVPPPLGGGGFAPPPVKAPGKPAAPAKLRVRSTRLRATAQRTRVRIRLQNPRRTSESVRVRIRTVDRVKVGRSHRQRTIVGTTAVRLPASGSRTVALRLSADARRVLARTKSVRVRVSVTPRSGVTTTRVVRLSR